MAEYKDSPSSELLNLGGMGPPSVYGGSQTGSEFGYGTPQSIGLDTVMQSGSTNSLISNSAVLGSYRSAQTGNGGPVQNYGGVYDQPVLPPLQVTSGLHQHRGSRSGLDVSSPVIGQHHHRLSISSNGPYAHNDRRNSELAGSDSMSPGNNVRPGIGDDVFAHNSNDTVNSQNQHSDEAGLNRSGDPEQIPAWSELKTKAGKERKRLPLACIACRRKKIRCSGEKPACKHCLRSRIPCVYKVTTRKAAPRTDYMAMLDKRLKRMEERVIKIIPKEEQGIVSSTGRAVVRPALPPPPPKSNGSKKRGAEQAFGDELDEWASAKAAVSADSKDATQATANHDIPTTQDAEEHNLLLEGADKLPSRELQEHLAEVFFDYVYGQSYHLLHKPSFMRRFEQRTVPPVLMLAVCAISARFSSHPAVRTEPAFLRGEQWAAPTREIALRRYDTPNITILLVYLILGLHEFGTCQGGRSWMFCGMAQRMAYALQLHNDLDHDPKIRRNSEGKNREGDLTFTDREIRRRTMWSCFLMDRFTSSGTDRPIFVAEQYIRAQLPIREDYYLMEITGPTEDLEGTVPNPVEPDTGQVVDPKENMGVAAYLIRLVAVWGRVIHYMNLGGKDRDQQPMWSEGSTFQSIKSSLEAWHESLPDMLVYSNENLQNYASQKTANQFLFLHITHNQIILFMNRFALPTPGRRPAFPADMPTDFIQSASRAAFEAANQISALVHEAMDHLVVAPFAGYCAFFSSTVHINGAFSKNAQLEATSKQNLAWNVKFLTKMKKHWGMFHFVTENLRELYRRHADAARSGASLAAQAKAEGKEGADIFQYGDWFDRYPHGVSGTDYEEPSVEVKKEPGADAVLGQKSDLQTVEDFFSKLSPPSRAVHVQQQQQQAKKNNAKKRRASKSEKKDATANNKGQKAQQAELQALQHQAMQQSQQAQADLMATQGFADGVADMRQHSIAFPPGFQQPPNPLLGSPQQPMLSQLDRQMVLNSYAGIDHASHGFQQLPQHVFDQSGTAQDPFNLDAFAQGGGSMNQSNSAGIWGDPSTAWFMPFNMEPPTFGDDNNLFNNNSNFDWNNMAGFGDLGSLPPTGLTPGPVEVDTGQSVLDAGDRPRMKAQRQRCHIALTRHDARYWKMTDILRDGTKYWGVTFY
ncbi:hypothetical protein LTR56_009646 [Elasticomyces elasticus]|nr:hypothetical protein LTR56_009646 [Elasticomyces elasticus]KAK3660146.1 hypothetical protein LTR22_008153 [Elasticomyces elasticus]KAK4923451.1 hypothetical protein LTR49_009325 [Elasticomyces elasticus]KAK5752323.1 hypothetical protein LTS12_017624 [Elasticomyces elasticus]